MKKIISLLLAVLMMFSFVTVAFAEGESAETNGTETTAPEEGDGAIAIPDLGEYNWILDLPFWTVGPAFKLAKIALKLITVYLKVGKIFGLVEKDMDDYIIEVLTGIINGGGISIPGIGGAEETTEPTTAPPVAA